MTGGKRKVRQLFLHSAVAGHVVSYYFPIFLPSQVLLFPISSEFIRGFER